jgi:hypothetical protein
MQYHCNYLQFHAIQIFEGKFPFQQRIREEDSRAVMTLLGEISNDSTLVTTHYQRLNQDGEFEGQSDDYIPYDQRLEPYIVPVLFGFIFLLGVVGNGSLIFILCFKKSMRNLPNMFIFNLALGDLLVLVFTVPFTSTIYTFDSWPYGEFVCKASEFAKVLIICFIIFLVGIELLKEILVVFPECRIRHSAFLSSR